MELRPRFRAGLANQRPSSDFSPLHFFSRIAPSPPFPFLSPYFPFPFLSPFFIPFPFLSFSSPPCYEATL